MSNSYSNFNSIKVRLNRKGFVVGCFKPERFQFHKGTIKPICARKLAWACIDFNSIKVRLNREVPSSRIAEHAISIP